MSHVLRSTVQLAATVAAAAAVSRAADSARRVRDEIAVDQVAERDATPPVPTEPSPVQRLAVAPTHSFHPFGPAPSTAAERAVGFEPERALTRARVEERSQPEVTAEPEVRAEPDARAEPAMPVIEAPAAVAPLAPEDPQDEPVSAELEPEPTVQPRRATGSVSGSVTNVNGRGLRGMQVQLVDADKSVVGSATTSGGGQFTIDGVPPGSYRLKAFDDVEGDFEKSWFGGAKHRSATSFMVSASSAVAGIDVVLRSTARIDVKATSRKRKIDVVVRVTHRATGEPATGAVELSTKKSEHISVELVDGQAPISLTDVGKGAKKVRVFYGGDRRTRPAEATARVR